jgi:peptide/nickel transport system substrate-binding protein
MAWNIDSLSYIPDFHPLANPDLPAHPFDVAVGAALLNAVGWIDHDADPATPRVAKGGPNFPDGSVFTIDFWATRAEARQLAADIMKVSLSSCEIEADLASSFFRSHAKSVPVYTPVTQTVRPFLRVVVVS